MDRIETVVHFHQETKHHEHRMARSAGNLDWANQPDPFRRFEGAERLVLPLAINPPDVDYDTLYDAVPNYPPREISLESLSTFLRHSMAISAWKEYRGTRWALRINPSSGNLHPTECYLLITQSSGVDVPSGVFHYRPMDHALERRTELAAGEGSRWIPGLPENAFLVGLTSIYWREAWKYGERAFRYGQHDVGHAMAAIALSAAMHGWTTVPLTGCSDAEVARLLGVDRAPDFGDAEREEPGPLMLILATGETSAPDRSALATWRPDQTVLTLLNRAPWRGQANRLSAERVPWALIDDVTAAAAKDQGAFDASTAVAGTDWVPLHSGQTGQPARAAVPAARIMIQRRSAVSLDGRTSIDAESFLAILDRVVPRLNSAPWTSLGPPVCIHLLLFVHLVDGLDPGLYLLIRTPEAEAKLRRAITQYDRWSRPLNCPSTMPLYQLASGDTRRLAGRISCHQLIAAAGAFSCGMLAEFDEPLRRFGPWFYRRLFWETGVIGQVLYLEAEAKGIRGTGIGCFFDDDVHELLGLRGTEFQSLYHFTMGGPVEDTRLTTLPPYPVEHGS